MLVFPKLNSIKRHSITINEFKGLDKRPAADLNTLSESSGISSKNFPALTTRRGRRTVFTAPSGERITGIFSHDKAYLTTSYNGSTRLYYGDDFSSLSLLYTANEDDLESSMFCFYDNSVCLFNLKALPTEQSLMTSTIGAIDIPTRTSAPIFTDVTIYKNRVFGCRKKQIRACANDRVTDWDQNAEVENLGERAYLKNIEAKSDFTACTTYKDHALFFNADEVYELYGNDAEDFELQKIADLGCVSRFAVCEVGGVLYFLSKEGVVRYNGSSISLVSDAICDYSTDDSKAVLGGGGSTLYLKIAGKKNECVYTYNTQTELWAREGLFEGSCSAFFGGKVYFTDGYCVYKMDTPYEDEPQENDGASFYWEAVTQDIHLDEPRKKLASKINLYIKRAIAGRVEVAISYDNGGFQTLGSFFTEGGKTVCIPLPKTKSEKIRIKVCGWGEAQIDYISFSYTLGGYSKWQNQQ
ncbi:MAG: hypothetical protein IJ370_05890 [Oscillospiraceae bacterium]|nr:hypothetical protein [Oscillospiraceae bacterium]